MGALTEIRDQDRDLYPPIRDQVFGDKQEEVNLVLEEGRNLLEEDYSESNLEIADIGEREMIHQTGGRETTLTTTEIIQGRSPGSAQRVTSRRQ